MEFDAMQFGKYAPMFQRELLLLSSVSSDPSVLMNHTTRYITPADSYICRYLSENLKSHNFLSLIT